MKPMWDHVCSCDVCSPRPNEDRCRYLNALNKVPNALAGLIEECDVVLALMEQDEAGVVAHPGGERLRLADAVHRIKVALLRSAAGGRLTDG